MISFDAMIWIYINNKVTGTSSFSSLIQLKNKTLLSLDLCTVHIKG